MSARLDVVGAIEGGGVAQISAQARSIVGAVPLARSAAARSVSARATVSGGPGDEVPRERDA